MDKGIKEKGHKDTNKSKNVHGNCSHGVGLSMKALVLTHLHSHIHVMMTQLVSQTLCSVSKLDSHMAPHGELRHNTFMQLSMKALGADLTLPGCDNIHVMMTQLMSQTLTMPESQKTY